MRPQRMSKAHAARGLAAVAFVAALLFWQDARAPFAFVEPQPDPNPSILFVGDIMLDRGVAKHAMASSTDALFAGVLDLFKTADARVANLEGSITTSPSIAQHNNGILRFTFDPTLAGEALAPLDLRAVSLANNHAYDFYAAGYRSTQDYLRSWGIAPFGHPYNARDLSVQFPIREKGFCLVGYHSLYDAGTAEVLADIRLLNSNCYRVIVFAHWGDEYETVANDSQVAAAREFIDAGADLVIGAHPHVVQNVEVYKGKAVFYSLGNFMFDQDFSWETQHGLAVRAEFGEAFTSFTLTPVTIENREVRVANEPDSARVLGLTGRLAEFTLP